MEGPTTTCQLACCLSTATLGSEKQGNRNSLSKPHKQKQGPPQPNLCSFVPTETSVLCRPRHSFSEPHPIIKNGKRNTFLRRFMVCTFFSGTRFSDPDGHSVGCSRHNSDAGNFSDAICSNMEHSRKAQVFNQIMSY